MLGQRTARQPAARGLLMLLAVALVIFAVFELRPASYASRFLGPGATPFHTAAFEERLGLDQPPPVRLGLWAASMLRGDFGQAASGGSRRERTVADVIGPRLGRTLVLAALALAALVPLALGFGTVAALADGRLAGDALGGFARMLASVPSLLVVLTLAAVAVLSGAVHWPAAIGDAPLWPVLVLVLATVGPAAAAVRARFLEILHQPHSEMARLRGLSPWHVVHRHVYPSAWAPLAGQTLAGGALFAAALIVVEAAMLYPGIGQLLVHAAEVGDAPVAQACALLFAGAIIASNVAAQALAHLAGGLPPDPVRVRT